ncbi:MAG: fused MFS/spermidine synthase [Planctomycetota bacterium]
MAFLFKKTNATATVLIGIFAFFSGFAALSHELLWTRRLIDVLGATDWVVGRVLGLFFLGISLGAYLATRQLQRNGSAINQLIVVEVCIAILSIPAAFLPFWTDWIWGVLGPENLVGWTGTLAKLLIGVLAVLPPSIAMGFSLPLFIRTVTVQGKDLASVGIWIYALNTLGGVGGLWFTSTQLVERCGALGSMLAIVLLNMLVAGVVWLYSKSSLYRPTEAEGPISTQTNDDQGTPERPIDSSAMSHRASKRDRNQGLLRSWPGLVCFSFLSGFIVLSLEILLLRLVYLVVPSSFFSTSALLANVIMFLAVGSILISLSSRNERVSKLTNNQRFVGVCLFGAALLICLCPIVLFEMTDTLMSVRYLQGLNDRTIDSVGHYWMLVFWLVATTGGVALLLSSLVFPSIMKMSSEEDPDGKNIGLLLCANGIGGLLGGEFCNMVLIEWVGVYAAFTCLGALTLVCGARLMYSLNRLGVLMSTASVAFVVLIIHLFNLQLPYISPRSVKKFVIEESVYGREGVLLVVKDEKQSKSILVNGQYVLGSSGVTDDQRRQLTLPWVLHQKSKTVCSLGLATGISASGLEILERPPAITAIELSSKVEAIARRHFASETNGFFDRPENQVVIEDARIYMAASENRFDLIVGDLYRPHGSGEGRLFSVEHFQNVRRALTDDGLYCQWLPAYQLNFKNWKTIAATFRHVFPNTLVVFGNENDAYPVVGLIGRKSELNWNAPELTASIENMPKSIRMNDPLSASFQDLIVGVLKPEAYPEANLNTLDNLNVELSAGRFWMLKDLRKKRPYSFESEFIKGRSLDEFVQRLDRDVTPIWPDSAHGKAHETVPQLSQ